MAGPIVNQNGVGLGEIFNPQYPQFTSLGRIAEAILKATTDDIDLLIVGEDSEGGSVSLKESNRVSFWAVDLDESDLSYSASNVQTNGYNTIPSATLSSGVVVTTPAGRSETFIIRGEEEDFTEITITDGDTAAGVWADHPELQNLTFTTIGAQVKVTVGAYLNGGEFAGGEIERVSDGYTATASGSATVTTTVNAETWTATRATEKTHIIKNGDDEDVFTQAVSIVQAIDAIANDNYGYETDPKEIVISQNLAKWVLYPLGTFAGALSEVPSSFIARTAGGGVGGQFME